MNGSCNFFCFLCMMIKNLIFLLDAQGNVAVIDADLE